MRPQAQGAATAVLLALTVGVLAGCGGESSAGAGDESSVDGRTFLSTSVTPRSLVAGTRIRLTFDGDSLGADAGCNSLLGQVRVDGGRLVTDGSIGMTEMGCDQPLMDQDAWLAELLGSGPELRLNGDDLTLRAADGTVVELVDRRVADPDRPLAGTKWVLDGIIEGAGPDGAVSSVPQDVTATLRISADGQLTLTTGCNTGSGSVDIGDGVLRLDWTYLTEMDCAGDRMRVEQAVQTALSQDEIAYSIEADRLTLTNGPHGLVYRAKS
ncbi:MAG: META domain-containing protein [Nocardioidaceae bacterium]|nr:META domain-containing protein [Nocardioidaceae bacterium]